MATCLAVIPIYAGPHPMKYVPLLVLAGRPRFLSCRDA